MGAPYIYDVSRLRVKTASSLILADDCTCALDLFWPMLIVRILERF